MRIYPIKTSARSIQIICPGVKDARQPLHDGADIYRKHTKALQYVQNFESSTTGTLF